MALVDLHRINKQYVEINKTLNDIEKAHLINLLLKKPGVMKHLKVRIEIQK